MTKTQLSIIIPTLNEEKLIERTQLTIILIRVLYLLKFPPASYEWLWPPVC